MIKGYIDHTNVSLSTIKLKSLKYLEGIGSIKEFDESLFNLKSYAIKDIKGFKKFLSSKTQIYFKDVLNFKKEIRGNMPRVIISCEDDVLTYTNNTEYLTGIYDIDYLKAFFKEFKVNDIKTLIFNYRVGYPLYIQLNNEGFFVAPRIED